MRPPWSSGNFSIRASGIGYLTLLFSTSSGYSALKIVNCSFTSLAFSNFSRSAGVKMCSFLAGLFLVASTFKVVYLAFSPIKSYCSAFKPSNFGIYPLSTVFSVSSDCFCFIWSYCSNFSCFCWALKASFCSLRYFCSSSLFSRASCLAIFSWIFFYSRSAAF